MPDGFRPLLSFTDELENLMLRLIEVSREVS